MYAGDPKTNPIMLTPVRSADAGGFAVFKVCGLVYKQGASLAVGGLNDFSADVPAKILFYTHDTKVPNLLSIKNCVQLYTFLKSLMWRLLVEFPINDGVAWEKVGHAAAFNFLAWNLEIKMNVLFSGDDFIVTRIFINILARYIYEIFFSAVVNNFNFSIAVLHFDKTALNYWTYKYKFQDLMYVNTTAFSKTGCDSTVDASIYPEYNGTTETCTEYDQTPNKCSVCFCLKLTYCIVSFSHPHVFLQWMTPTTDIVVGSILTVDNKPQGMLTSLGCDPDGSGSYISSPTYAKMSIFRNEIISAADNMVDNM